MWKTCPECGEEFFRDQPWKRMCIHCWKSKKRQEEIQQTAEYKRLENVIRDLQMEIGRLKAERYFQVGSPRKSESQIEEELFDWLRRLISLCHPDKHGGSEVANEATIWLLSLKEKAAQLGGQAA